MSTVIYHKHHIIPKHAGGTDHPDNIARLTPEEHAEAHRLLYEKYDRWQDKIAYEGLLGFKGKEQIIKEIQSRPKSEEEKKNMSIAAYNMTAEHKQKNSDWHQGKKHSTETRKKMSDSMKGEKNPLYGKTHTPETRKKMSEAVMGHYAEFGSALTGIPKSEEHKKKLSEAAKRKTI
jgi:hypothetical protein